MKNRMLIGLLALALVSTITSCSKKAEGYTINGIISGQKDGMMYLKVANEDKITVLDSAKITDGVFIFRGKIDEPQIYSIQMKGAEDVTPIFMENKDMSYKAQKDSIFDAKISGSLQDSIYKTFYNSEMAKFQKLAIPTYRLGDSLSQNGKIKLSAEQQKMVDKKYAVLDRIYNSITEKYIKEHKNDPAAALLVDERIVVYGVLANTKKYYNFLSPEVQKSFYGRKLKKGIEVGEKTEVGVTAPAISLADTNGKTVTLSDFKGKYVLVDFWASWCGPCRKENPNVVAAYQTYHDKGFEILGVSLDNKKEPWLKAIEKDDLTWIHVSDLKGWQSEAVYAYGIKGVPANFLIGPDGKIAAKNLRGETLISTLKEIFSK